MSSSNLASFPARLPADYGVDCVRTLDLFQKSGIAVFPSALRKKGTWIEDWPVLAFDDAVATTRRELARRATGLAGRTGDGFAVLDLDAKAGSPDATLCLLRELLGEAVFAIVATHRGYHLWVKVREPVGNGYCASIGGEIFSDAHLAMLPPSLHPDGGQYRWVVEPHPTAAVADLRVLGLVPDDTSAPSRQRGRKSPGRRAPAAPPEAQTEFRHLMERAGVVKTGSREQVLTRCPFHNDRHPSLSVNWAAAIYYCFSPACNKHGGWRSLARELGVDPPTYRQSRDHMPSEVAPLGDNLGCREADVDAQTIRLADALVELDLHERAQAARACRTYFRAGKCTNCARHPAHPISCGDPLCIRCMPGRLEADWTRRRGDLPESLTFVRLRPRHVISVVGARKTVSARFRDWRKRKGVEAGIYGVRLSSAGAEVLLAIPADNPLPESTRAFTIEVIARDRSPRDFVKWLRSEYVQEATSWDDAQQLYVLIEETRGRRRFQGFGGAYAKEDQVDERSESAGEETAKERKPLHRVSGGGLKGKHGREGPPCGFCGGKVEWFEFTVPADEVQQVGTRWLWKGRSIEFDPEAA